MMDSIENRDFVNQPVEPQEEIPPAAPSPDAEGRPATQRRGPEWLAGPWGKVALVMGIYSFIYIILTTFRFGGPNGMALISDLAFLPVSLFAFVFALRTARRGAIARQVRRAWFFIALAALSNFLADGIWAILELVLRQEPFPSLADLFYLLYYPLMTIALVNITTAMIPAGRRKRYIIEQTLVMVIFLVLLWPMLIYPVIAAASNDAGSMLISGLYPVGDVLLAAALFYLIFHPSVAGARQSYLLLLAGTLVGFIGDIVYSNQALSGAYVSGGWLDITWLLSYFLIGLAAMQHFPGVSTAPVEASAVEQEQPRAKPQEPATTGFFTRLVSPHPAIIDITERNRAQLLAGISLLATLTTLVGAASALAMRGIGPESITLLAMAACGLLAYALARSRTPLLGSLLLTISLSTAAFAIVVISPSHPISPLYSTIPMAFVAGSVLLSPAGMALLVAANVSAVASLPAILPGFVGSDAFTVGGLLASQGVLLLLTVLYRNSAERRRVQEVEAANRELHGVLASMEAHVANRTRDLALAAEVGRNLSQVRQLEQLLTQAVELILQRFNLYYAQVYLVDRTGRSLEMRSGTGSVGAELLRRRHRLPVDMSSINGSAAVEKRAVIVKDTTSSAIHRPNPLLPETRSEMAVPLLVGERVVGVLDMQSRLPGGLTTDSLPAFEALAGQLAVAIENARLFQEYDAARQRLEAHSRQQTAAGWEDYLNAIERGEMLGFVCQDQDVKPLTTLLPEVEGEQTLVAPIQVGGQPVGAYHFEAEQPWSAEDRDLVQVVVQQAAQQIESLRLYAQAERYRYEAETALRRLTRQGWKEFAAGLDNPEVGYFYDQNLVTPLQPAEAPGETPTAAHPLSVQDEQIGELAVYGLPHLDDEAREVLQDVATQLSAHLDNLRLIEQSQKALDEVQQSEQQLVKFRLGLEQSGDVVFITDTQGAIVYANPAFERVYGYQAEEVVGKTPRLLQPVLTGAGGFDAWQEKLSNKESVSGEVLHARKDGALIPIEAAMSPILDEAGELLGFLAVHRDISERKQVEQTLSRRAEQLAILNEMGRALTSLQDEGAIFETVHAYSARMMDTSNFSIAMLDADQQQLSFSIAIEEGQRVQAPPRALGEGLIDAVVRRGEALLISEDLPQRLAELGIQYPPPGEEHPAQSWLGVPMLFGEQVLGVIAVQSVTTPGVYTTNERDLLTAVASQAAIALQNARSFTQAQRQAEYEAMINAISQKIQSTSTIENALQVAVRELGRALGSKRASVQLSVAQQAKPTTPRRGNGS